MEIIEAKESDLPDIARLAREIWEVCYRDVVSDEQIEHMLNWMYSLETMKDELKNKGVCYDKLLIDGRLVGFAAYGPAEKPGKMKLHKLYIHHDFQRKGCGSKMLKHIEEKAAMQGYNSLILNVNKKNTKAIGSYKKNGFFIASSPIIDIGNGFLMDDHIMEKTLQK